MSKELEDKFKEAVTLATEEINKQLDIAKKAIAEAEKISEEYGVPFSTYVSPLGQSYRPNSFDDKWGDLENADDIIEDMTGDFLPEYEGWEHSAVC